MRELVEELQATQYAELFLAVDPGIRLAQMLVDPRQLGCEVEAALVALLRFLLQRHGRDILELLGNVLA